MEIIAFIKDIKWKTIKMGLGKYLHGDKEVWEYDFIGVKLTFLVRFFYLCVYFLVGMMPFFMILLVVLDIEVEYLGVFFGAIAAGIFTTISSLSNTESNIRNIRSSWIDESRKDFTNYMSMGRRFLAAHHALKLREIEVSGLNDGDNEGVSKYDLDKLDEEQLDRKIIVKEFYEVYLRVTLRFRGKKKGAEKEVYQKLNKHYNKYMEMARSIRKAGLDELKSPGFKSQSRREDIEMVSFFGDYLNDEWKRAKRGDADILNKKKALFAILVFFGFFFFYILCWNKLE